MKSNIHPFDVDDIVADFMALGLAPGDLISHEDMWSLLGLVFPSDDAPNKWAKEQELMKVGRFDKLRSALLERKNIDLASVAGYGYRIVPPSEQVGLAMHQTRERMQGKLSRGILRVACVDRSALTDKGRVDQADALAKLEAQRSMLRKPRGGW